MIEYREGPCPLCWRQWSSSCSSPGLWRCSGWCSSPGVIPFLTQISISIYTATVFKTQDMSISGWQQVLKQCWAELSRWSGLRSSDTGNLLSLSIALVFSGSAEQPSGPGRKSHILRKSHWHWLNLWGGGITDKNIFHKKNLKLSSVNQKVEVEVNFPHSEFLNVNWQNFYFQEDLFFMCTLDNLKLLKETDKMSWNDLINWQLHILYEPLYHLKCSKLLMDLLANSLTIFIMINKQFI